MTDQVIAIGGEPDTVYLEVPGPPGPPGSGGLGASIRDRLATVLPARDTIEELGYVYDNPGTSRTVRDPGHVDARIYLRAAGIVDPTTEDCGAALALADADAALAEVPLRIVGRVNHGASPITFTSLVDFWSGSGFLTGSGAVTHNGGVFCGPRQCWQPTTSVTLGGDAVPDDIYAQWFGAKGSSANNTAAIQAALDCAAVSGQGAVKLAGCRLKCLNQHPLWTSGTVTAIGDKVHYGANTYVAASAGTKGATAPVHTSGTTSDGGVDWTWLNAYVIGMPSGVLMRGQALSYKFVDSINDRGTILDFTGVTPGTLDWPVACVSRKGVAGNVNGQCERASVSDFALVGPGKLVPGVVGILTQDSRFCWSDNVAAVNCERGWEMLRTNALSANTGVDMFYTRCFANGCMWGMTSDRTKGQIQASFSQCSARNCGFNGEGHGLSGWFAGTTWRDGFFGGNPCTAVALYGCLNTGLDGTIFENSGSTATMTRVRSEGSAPPTATLSGTPIGGPWQLRIEAQGAGASTINVKFSTDNGATFSGDISVSDNGVPVALSDPNLSATVGVNGLTGLSVAFASGTFSDDNAWTAFSTPDCQDVLITDRNGDGSGSFSRAIALRISTANTGSTYKRSASVKAENCYDLKINTISVSAGTGDSATMRGVLVEDSVRGGHVAAGVYQGFPGPAGTRVMVDILSSFVSGYEQHSYLITPLTMQPIDFTNPTLKTIPFIGFDELDGRFKVKGADGIVHTLSDAPPTLTNPVDVVGLQLWLGQSSVPTLVSASIDPDLSTWTGTHCTKAVATGEDPDGGDNAYRITDSVDSVNTLHSFARTPSSWIAGPTLLTLWLQADSLPWARVLFGSGSNSIYLALDSGLTGTSVGAVTARKFTGPSTGWQGWYLQTNAVTSGTQILVRPATGNNQENYTGDGTGSILMGSGATYGPKLEQSRLSALTDLSGQGHNGSQSTDALRMFWRRVVHDDATNVDNWVPLTDTTGHLEFGSPASVERTLTFSNALYDLWTHASAAQPITVIAIEKRFTSPTATAKGFNLTGATAIVMPLGRTTTNVLTSEWKANSGTDKAGDFTGTESTVYKAYALTFDGSVANLYVNGVLDATSAVDRAVGAQTFTAAAIACFGDSIQDIVVYTGTAIQNATTLKNVSNYLLDECGCALIQ